MAVPALPPEWYHRRFQAVGRAQSRYLFLLLIVTAYSMGLSFNNTATAVRVEFLGLTSIPMEVVNAATMVVLDVLLLATFGTLQAVREAFADLVARLGDDGVTNVGMRYVDEHPNLADFLSYATFVRGKRTRLTRYGALLLYPAPVVVAAAWTFHLWSRGATACTLEPRWLTPVVYRAMGTALLLPVLGAATVFLHRRWEVFKEG